MSSEFENEEGPSAKWLWIVDNFNMLIGLQIDRAHGFGHGHPYACAVGDVLDRAKNLLLIIDREPHLALDILKNISFERLENEKVEDKSSSYGYLYHDGYNVLLKLRNKLEELYPDEYKAEAIEFLGKKTRRGRRDEIRCYAASRLRSFLDSEADSEKKRCLATAIIENIYPEPAITAYSETTRLHRELWKMFPEEYMQTMRKPFTKLLDNEFDGRDAEYWIQVFDRYCQLKETGEVPSPMLPKTTLSQVGKAWNKMRFEGGRFEL